MITFDTHVHFHFPDFDKDREQVIENARKSGVSHFINVGTDLESSLKSLELAKKYDFIRASAGIHPHDAQKADQIHFNQIEELLKEPEMAAIGEIGLDFYRDHSPHSVQKEVFVRFLEIQSKIKKPLIVHCRDAHRELAEVLLGFKNPPFQGVMHCFSSDKDMMFEYLDLGFYISFAAPLTYKKNDDLRAACQACPKDRILFETDAPFLPPQTKRGQRNESSYMLETLQIAAEIRGTPLEALGEQSFLNAKALFNL